MAEISAHWDTRTLLTSLARAGWGDLSGRANNGVRAYLKALTDLLPYKSGQGLCTAAQVMDAAGYTSDKWARVTLAKLEDLGIVEWTRGGIIDGAPAPGFMRIVKSKLVELIHAARDSHAEKLAARKAKTAERLSRLTKPKARIMGQRRSAPVHAVVSGSLSTPYGGVLMRDTPAVKDSSLKGQAGARAIAAEKERQKQARIYHQTNTEIEKIQARTGLTAGQAARELCREKIRKLRR